MTLLRTIFLTSILLLVAVNADLLAGKKSYAGIYRTADDFLKRKKERVGTFQGVFKEGDEKVLIFNDRGYKNKFYASKIWGFRNNQGHYFRCYKEILRIGLKGHLYIYGGYRAKIRSPKLSKFKMTSSDGYYISRGPKGSVEVLRTSSVEYFIRDDRPLLSMYRSMSFNKRFNQMIDFVIKYNMRKRKEEKDAAGYDDFEIEVLFGGEDDEEL